MIISAQYANPDNTSAVMMTDDLGAVAVETGTPAWAELMAWGAPSPYVEPPLPIPESISDRQFFQALANKGVITHDEALYAVKLGTIPAALQSYLASLTGDAAFNAEMLLAGATQFNRSHPLTNSIGQALGYSASDLDDFWRYASGL